MNNNNLYLNDIKKAAEINVDWDKLNGTTVMITGASGLINSSLIDILMYRNQHFNNNIHIIAVGRNIQKLASRFSAYSNNNELEFLLADVNKPIDYSTETDYIINGASNTHPVAYATQPIETILTNVIGTNNMLSLAVNCKAKRFVQMSTVEVYGENRGDTDSFAEDYCGYIDCNKIRAGYPESKRTSEALCQAYIAKHDLDIVIARPCRIYGPTMGMDDSKASAQFIKNALEGKDIVLKSEGMQEFSYCYMIDVATALIYIMLNGSKGEAYNISDKESNIRLRDFAALVAEQNGRKVIFDLPDEIEKKGASAVTKSLLCSSKLESLGWRAQTHMKDGILKTIEILKTNMEVK